MGWYGVWFGDYPDTDDITPPEIDLVSPEDFSETFATATATPVVLDVTDASPGLRTVTIFASGSGLTGVQTVYYSGAYTPSFSSSSSTTAISGGTRFSVLPERGWSGGTLTLTVEAVDQDGNHSEETFTWSITSQAAAVSSGSPGYPFRDSVWRWRRRLARQKCSVISVAIEDSYSPNAGFTLTALALEVGRKPGLDRTPWRGGTFTNRSGSGNTSDGQ